VSGFYHLRLSDLELSSGSPHIAGRTPGIVNAAPTPSLDRLPAASLQFEEQLWHARKAIRDIMRWSFWVAIWLAALGILGLLGLDVSRYFLIAGVLVLVIGGVFAGVTGIPLISDSRRVGRALDEWETAVAPFLYAVKFELLPIVDASREKDIWDRYKSIWHELSPAGDKKLRPLLMSSSNMLAFGESIKGRKAPHSFDIYARVDGEISLFVRRFVDEAPVGKPSLEKLISDAEDVLDRSDSDITIVSAFSKSGFSGEAIEYAKGRSEFDEETDLELISETEHGYRITFVGPYS